MGRTRKSGLDYFPVDIDMFQDIRIRKLIKYQSGKAVTVYTVLLCIIYKSGYYIKWDEELPFIISEITGFDEAYISEVITCCLKLGLFNQDLFNHDSVLTSKGIQERYQLICMLSRRVCDIRDYNVVQDVMPPQQTATKHEESKMEDATDSPDGSLSYAQFRRWMHENTPEIANYKAPSREQWQQLKNMMGSLSKLQSVAREIAANVQFRKKWDKTYEAFAKWLSYDNKKSPTTSTAEIIAQREQREREQQEDQREREARSKRACTHEQAIEIIKRAKHGDEEALNLLKKT